jgi:hypothetical protein
MEMSSHAHETTLPFVADTIPMLEPNDRSGAAKTPEVTAAPKSEVSEAPEPPPLPPPTREKGAVVWSDGTRTYTFGEVVDAVSERVWRYRIVDFRTVGAALRKARINVSAKDVCAFTPHCVERVAKLREKRRGELAEEAGRTSRAPPLTDATRRNRPAPSKAVGAVLSCNLPEQLRSPLDSQQLLDLSREDPRRQAEVHSDALVMAYHVFLSFVRGGRFSIVQIPPSRSRFIVKHFDDVFRLVCGFLGLRPTVNPIWSDELSEDGGDVLEAVRFGRAEDEATGGSPDDPLELEFEDEEDDGEAEAVDEVSMGGDPYGALFFPRPALADKENKLD